MKFQVPLPLFGGSGNYASALYISAVKANALDIVESEIVDFVDASNRSEKFSELMKNLSVPRDARAKAVTAILSETKFSDVTKNFLVVLAENGRLRNLESIVENFLELAMAHQGEVKAVVTSVIPLPPQEEKELKETLQDIIGHGKKVKLEQRYVVYRP
ncbi:ATP synthase subunit O, mitochondrial [Vitis vinifera]|uniref:ATP synthase subunit O, mitochondrial n=1 Tax=Vitis vinifera TaxID=29760 RepID=A0A438G4M4_VITVI|nr:ATP synthase subunit O, mitochondrial [Vitis vinifera]